MLLLFWEYEDQIDSVWCTKNVPLFCRLRLQFSCINMRKVQQVTQCSVSYAFFVQP